MTTRTFGDLTSWHHLQPIRIGGGWDPGWRPTDGAFADNIGRADTYWGEVLQRAKQAYGDPNMRYDTDDTAQDRHLVFGDGTRVPADGSLAYRDASTSTTYLLNTDGSVSPLDGAGRAGDPIVPTGLRRAADGQLAPIDSAGHQVAPLVPQPPATPYGYHDDGGVLTPKNAAGDYYTLGPDGRRRFFDPHGAPIDEDRFTKDSVPVAIPPDGSESPTGEQQSGHAAAAVKELQDEMRQQYGRIGRAEERLSEAVLSAHATTVAGRDRLDAIQRDIVGAVDDPTMSLDSSAGQQAYLKFLRAQIGAIHDVVDSGSLTAEDRAKVADAISDLYASDAGDAGDDRSAAPTGAEGSPSAPIPAPAPVVAEPTSPDLGLGPAPAMPDPTLSDVLGGPMGGLGTDPLGGLLPGMLGGLGGLAGGGGLGGGDPFGLGGLTGAASPLAGLASQIRDTPRPLDSDDERAAEDGDGHRHVASDDHPDPEPTPMPAADPAPDQQPGPPADPAVSGTPGAGAPPAAPGPAPAPTSTVALPDGSATTAKTPALARAVTTYLTGTPIEQAYRSAGIDLPPPGTPVTNPADPAQLSCGFLGMFTDHYVVAASAVKAITDGQVVPLSTVTSSPDFLGWLDPSTLAGSPPAPSPVPADPAPPPLPAETGAR